MADQYPKETKENHAATKVGEDCEEPASGCGMFDFLKKKKENEKSLTEEHKHTLAEKLHRHNGSDSSSSSSDEEGREKKKKGAEAWKSKIKGKISGKKDEEDAYLASAKTKDIDSGEEKKGFIEKIKEKLPGQHKEAEVGVPAEHHAPREGEPKEKKTIMEKIKEKLPGGNKNEEEKAKEY